tara:strand:+ start:5646 stop:7253 length:1608 start_codon:yes stop_codon:yes gene_type:complete
MNRHELHDLGGGTSSGLLAARASQAPDNLALVFCGREYSYGELDRQATAVAGGLMALGIKQGEAVSIFVSNRPEYLMTSYGLSRAGMITVPINLAYKGEFLQYVIEHSDATVLVIESAFAAVLGTLAQWPSALQTIIYIGDEAPQIANPDVRIISWDELLASGDANPEFPTVLPQDTGAISFTSGTTGKSKGVVSPNLQGVVMARETAIAFGLTPRDRLYTCMPLFHGMAQVTTCLAAIYAGAAIILSPRFSVSNLWEEVRASKATQFNALGSMLHMLLSTPPSPLDREHDVQCVFAAPAPPEVLYRFESRFGVHVLEGYGQTEIKNVIYNPRYGRKIGSLGKPTASSIIEIHDDNGDALPSGMIGEIVYRPRMPNIMLKYYHRNADATLSSMRGLWWHTGDLGSMDDDGFVYFHDRKSDSLRRRGENISSQEVEAALVAFSSVVDAAAVGVHSDVGEDEVLVVFESSQPENFDFEALFQHCVHALPRFMVPRYYRLMASMPRTPTGKVRKVALREDGLTADIWDHVQAGLVVPR